MKPLLIFKLGGRILEDQPRLERFLENFAALPQRKILVHGGGVLAEQLAEKLGIPSAMHEGRRITSAAMRDLVTMVYGGGINKNLVSQLQKRGCVSLGLTGADLGLIEAVKRPPEPIDFGFVGDIVRVRADRLIQLLKLGLCPVIAPLSWDGEILNSNADTIASRLAESLAPHYEVQLIFGFEQLGVLRSLGEPESLIPELTRSTFETLRTEGAIAKGMIPKLTEGFRASSGGVKAVLIARDDQGLRFAQGKSWQGTQLSEVY